MIPQPIRIEWLDDWDRKIEDTRQRNYMHTELLRLKGEGLPLLTCALSAPLPEQVSLALSVLRNEMGVNVAYLRLARGAQPPIFDPDGRPLPESLRGKALSVKIGTIGQSLDGSAVGDSWRTTGPGRIAMLAAGRSLYRSVLISDKPLALPLADAMAVLRQWGVGVAAPPRARYSPDGSIVTTRNRWLVEELADPYAQPAPPEPVQPQPRQRREAA